MVLATLRKVPEWAMTGVGRTANASQERKRRGEMG
jgi:hypothetical protein